MLKFFTRTSKVHPAVADGESRRAPGDDFLSGKSPQERGAALLYYRNLARKEGELQINTLAEMYPFEVQVTKFCDVIKSDALSDAEREKLANAMNTLFDEEGISSNINRCSLRDGVGDLKELPYIITYICESPKCNLGVYGDHQKMPIFLLMLRSRLGLSSKEPDGYWRSIDESQKMPESDIDEEILFWRVKSGMASIENSLSREQGEALQLKYNHVANSMSRDVSPYFTAVLEHLQAAAMPRTEEEEAVMNNLLPLYSTRTPDGHSTVAVARDVEVDNNGTTYVRGVKVSEGDLPPPYTPPPSPYESTWVEAWGEKQAEEKSHEGDLPPPYTPPPSSYESTWVEAWGEKQAEAEKKSTSRW